VQKTVGFRLDEDAEVEGIDSAEHAETSYDLNVSMIGGRASAGAGTAAQTGAPSDARHEGSVKA